MKTMLLIVALLGSLHAQIVCSDFTIRKMPNSNDPYYRDGCSGVTIIKQPSDLIAMRGKYFRRLKQCDKKYRKDTFNTRICQVRQLAKYWLFKDKRSCGLDHKKSSGKFKNCIDDAERKYQNEMSRLSRIKR